MRDAKPQYAESTQSTGRNRSGQVGSRVSALLPGRAGGIGAPSTSRRARRIAAATAAVSALGLALAASPALAVDNGHAFSFSFKGSGTNALSSNIGSIDVDNSSGPSAGSIYVGDSENRRVEKFDPAGNFVLMFGDGVNATTGGDVCTAASGDTCQAGAFGSGPENIQPRYIAVDQTSGPSQGDVYVVDTNFSQRNVHKFDENGNLITSWGTGGALNASEIENGPFKFILGIDVDGAGNLLVSNEVEGSSTEQTRVFEFAQDGAFATQYTTAAGDTSESFAWGPPDNVFRMRSQWVRRSSAVDGAGTLTMTINPYENPLLLPLSLYPRGIAVDPSTGTLYEMMENFSGGKPRVWEFEFNGSGQPLDSAGSPCAATLTPTGEGCPPTHEFGGSAMTQEFGAGAVAVDSASDKVYVTERAKSSVLVFVGGPEPLVTTGDPVAKKKVSGSIDPDGAGEIAQCTFEYGTSTAYGSSLPCAEATPYPGSGVQAVTATLPVASETTYHYRLVAKTAGGALAFGADKTLSPHNVDGVDTLGAENITRTTAKLTGTFQGNGDGTEFYFQWGESTAYGHESTPTPAGSPTYPPATPVSDIATNLEAETEYHFRVVATNSEGTTFGPDRTFETLPPVQSLTAEAANPVGRKFATLHGSFLGDGDHTTYKFEWGKTISYVNSTSVGDAGSPNGVANVSAELTGLELETEYHYRVAATNSLGTTYSNDMTFVTLPAVPGLVTKPATDISQTGITLHGEYLGNGEATHYYFEYGLSTNYDHASPELPGIDAGSPSGATPLSAVITDYEAYSTYHYRVVATNAEGPTYGNDLTFTTLPAQLPTIDNTTASNVNPTGAMLEADVNPNRWATIYLFEYGTSSAYNEATEISSSIGSDEFAHTVDEQVSNLAPGTTYHFRAVAINFTGTTYGPDQTLTTPDVPRIDLTNSSAIGETTAHLSGLVSPRSSETMVSFEYGTSTFYGRSTPGTAIGSDGDDHTVGADLSGLLAGTTYHFRIVASNAFGTTNGPDQTFTTAAPVQQKITEEQPPKACKKGFVKRHGKCVKKKKHKKRHHRHSTHRDG